jgi:hypothetical protein
MLFDAHEHAFNAFGGVPRRGIYDNMKTAVDKVRTGKDRDVNARFEAMVGHYLFDAEFCNPASGWEKGQIEKNVRDSRHRIWQKVPPMKSLDELNAWLTNECFSLWKQVKHPEADITVWDAWEIEQPHLMRNGRPFDGFVEHTKRVSPTCLVTFERNRYSVPASFANRPVSVRVYCDRLVFVAEGKTIAEHARNYSGPWPTRPDYLQLAPLSGGTSTQAWRITKRSPIPRVPDEFKRLQALLLKRPGGDREMVEILALVMFQDEKVVLAAVKQALDAGAPSKQIILNMLSRLLDTAPPQKSMPLRP